MPRSKRDKTVSLTKTGKRSGLANKQTLAAAIRNCVDDYESIFVFSVENMRNSKLKDLRNLWNDSRFFMGKTKVMKLGLGLTAETEAGTNLHELTSCLEPQCGLLFTDRPQCEVFEFMRKYRVDEYARAGNIAPRTVVLPEGPLHQMSFAIEERLRKLGLPVRMDAQVVTLMSDHTVCTEGEVLRPEQTRILQELGIKLVQFHVTIKCVWVKSTGEVSYPEPYIIEVTKSPPLGNGTAKSVSSSSSSSFEVGEEIEVDEDSDD